MEPLFLSVKVFECGSVDKHVNSYRLSLWCYLQIAFQIFVQERPMIALQVFQDYYCPGDNIVATILAFLNFLTQTKKWQSSKDDPH